MSSVLNRFQTSPSDHLCALFENALQLANVTTGLRSASSPHALLEALKFHVLYSKNVHLKSDHFYRKAFHFYTAFLRQTQSLYKENAANFLDYFTYFLLAFSSFTLTIYQLFLEYRNSASILFTNKWLLKFKSYNLKSVALQLKDQLLSTSPQLDHLIFLVFIFNFTSHFSTNFMQLEGHFWNSLSIGLLAAQMVATLIASKRAFTRQLGVSIASTAFVIFLLFLAFHWRQVNTVEDTWRADTNLQDIYFYLSKSPFTGSLLFTLSLAIIAVYSLASVESHFSFICSSLYLTIYLIK